ncbi:MAG: hypothetical protein ACOCUV_00875 [bacterium]
MKKLHFATIFVFAILLGCAPKGLYMVNGEKLDDKIKSQKVNVAVLPTVDWYKPETAIQGYLSYGCSGLFGTTSAYSDAGHLVTNELTKSLWKKNSMNLIKKDVLIDEFTKQHLNKDEIFPEPEYKACNTYPKSIDNEMNLGVGAPNYEKIYRIGKNTGADIIILSRVTKNAQVGLLPQNPIGALPPFTIVTGLGQYAYKAFVKKYKMNYIVIDFVALDVNKKEIIAFGGYNQLNELPTSEKKAAMEQYTDAITFYAPLPDDEDLQKAFIAEAASYATTHFTNYVLTTLTGMTITTNFKFKYEVSDETWKMYPDGYFEENYGLTVTDYKKMLR